MCHDYVSRTSRLSRTGMAWVSLLVLAGGPVAFAQRAHTPIAPPPSSAQPLPVAPVSAPSSTVRVTTIEPAVPPPMHNPAPVVVTRPTYPTPAAEPVGDVTRQLLALQSGGTMAGAAASTPGVVASRAWTRYLDSFKHPLPEWFKTKVSEGQ